MEENEIKNSSNQSLKIQLSLASLMFFSPFVQNLLKKDSFDLSNDDRIFVSGYLSLGWLSLILLGISLLFGGLNYFFPSSIISLFSTVSISILVGFLCLGSIGAVTETSLKTSHKTTKDMSTLGILLSYLPIYSLYLRYEKHNFDTPDLIVKESILLRIALGLSCFIPHPIGIIIVSIVIFTRIVSNIGKKELLPQKISDFISSLFYKNPEEIRAYLWGSIIFVFKGIYTRAYWKTVVSDIKKEYEYLYEFKKFGTIQWQYGLLLVGIVFIFWQINLGNIPGGALFAILLILARYGLMLWFWGRSPNIPLFREIISFIGNFFTSKK